MKNYKVEFVYDGQNYEPTTYLATSNGDSNSYKNATTSKRDEWAKDSKATDINRNEVNERVSYVSGNLPIDGNGNTTGKISSNNIESNIYYTSDASISNRNISDIEAGITSSSRINSSLKTRNNDATVKDVFKTKAGTNNLCYIFDDRVNLTNYDINYDNNKYVAVYNYLNNINLGLIEREKVDISVSKEMVDAKVVIKDRLIEYNFENLSNTAKKYTEKSNINLTKYNGVIDSNALKYEIGLYKTDYYYRAEIFKSANEYNKINNYYKNIIGYENGLEDTEMEIYLTYKISLYNESNSYIVDINSITDYYDSSLKLVNKEVKKYLQTDDGKESDLKNLVVVAKPSMLDGTERVNWTDDKDNIYSSDFNTYNKMTANLENVSLKSKEKAEIYVTFEVEKDTIEGVYKAIELGDKNNLVEISNYSTYYENNGEKGNIAGKIDKKSAVDNLNILNYNYKTWYEEDTNYATTLNIDIASNSKKRTVSGVAWEDNSNQGNIGMYDKDEEALIGGLTTQLVEKVKIPNIIDNSQTVNDYTEYEFVWPTNKSMDSLGGKTIEYLTDFDSTIETSRVNTEETAVGEYKFQSIPIGNYVVRFLYGIDKGTLSDTKNITGYPQALKSDGTKFSDDILTANYDEDKIGKTSAIYNGHDYKTVAYQMRQNSCDEEWYTGEYTNEKEISNSDFRDDEVRRLEVMSNTVVLTNSNTSDLIQANRIDGNHTEICRKYYMYADTPRININGYLKANEMLDEKSDIFNVNIGLTERPETEIILDKQISSIKITTNDDKVIFDAEYTINYEFVTEEELKNSDYTTILGKIKENNITKYLVAIVNLDENKSIGINLLQAINKAENKLVSKDEINSCLENFRYINIDNDIMQGAKIEINYKITTFNLSETDTISKNLYKAINANEFNGQKYMSAKETISAIAKELLKERNTYMPEQARGIEQKNSTYGKYIGKNYYTNSISSDELITTTRIQQLITFADNDMIFSEDNNNANNHTWINTRITDLKGSGFNYNRIIDIPTYNILDSNDVAYISNQKNNVILSLARIRAEEETLNSEFEKELIPYSMTNNEKLDEDQKELNFKSEIELTLTKVISSDIDTDNLSFNNLSEIVRYENSSGRRDETIVLGNASPKLGEYAGSISERDSSSSERVTFVPPTGTNVENVLIMQILLCIIISTTVVVIGIIYIKKRVLIKR